MTKRQSPKRVLDAAVNLPAFASESDEVAFWDTHDFSDEFMRSGPPATEDMLPAVRDRSTQTGAMDASELRARRTQLGMTQAQLGEALAIPRATISRWESRLMPIEHGQVLRLALERLADRATTLAS